MRAYRPSKIFISHSSEDKALVRTIKLAFEDSGFSTVLVRPQPDAKAPIARILPRIRSSDALFAFLTPRSVKGNTRDWIVFEIGAAKGSGLPVYIWKSRGRLRRKIPKFVEQMVSYGELVQSKNGQDRLTREIRSTLRKIVKLSQGKV